MTNPLNNKITEGTDEPEMNSYKWAQQVMDILDKRMRELNMNVCICRNFDQAKYAIWHCPIHGNQSRV